MILIIFFIVLIVESWNNMDCREIIICILLFPLLMFGIYLEKFGELHYKHKIRMRDKKI